MNMQVAGKRRQARRKIRRKIRSVLSAYPSLYLPIRRRLIPEGCVSRDTAFVIEGFPRSGNSFAEAAFRISQDVCPALAHHSHASAQVIQAARWGIPTLVLIRDPIDAISSLVIHEPHVFDVTMALREYNAFYRRIERYRSAFVLARFSSVTRDFGVVMRAVNEKFGTHFAVFDHSAPNLVAAYELIEKLGRERGTLSANSAEPYAPWASTDTKASRRTAKEDILERFRSDENAALTAEAHQLYDRFASTADV